MVALGFSQLVANGYVTLVVAAWGSLLLGFLALRRLRRGRPHVKVLTFPLGARQEDGSLREYWWVRVVNVNEQPVEVAQVGLTARSPRTLGRGQSVDEPVTIKNMRSARLPATLVAGESINLYFNRAGTGTPDDGPVRGAWARDSLDRQYEGGISLGMRGPTQTWLRLKLRPRSAR